MFFITVFEVKIEYFFDDKIKKNHKKILFLFSNIIINIFFKKKNLKSQTFYFWSTGVRKNPFLLLARSKNPKFSNS